MIPVKRYFADLEKAKEEAKKLSKELSCDIFIKVIYFGANVKTEYKLCIRDEFIIPPEKNWNVIHIEKFKPRNIKP